VYDEQRHMLLYNVFLYLLPIPCLYFDSYAPISIFYNTILITNNSNNINK
jgi:hypothetical protein